MKKAVIEVEGMQCGMCESHVNDVVRKIRGVNSAKASRANGNVEIIADDDVDIESVKQAISADGYGVGNVTTEPYEKKSIFSKLFRK